MKSQTFLRSAAGIGLITGVLLIVYFLIIRLLDLNYVIGYRFANIGLIAVAIIIVISYRKKRPEGLHYLSGTLSGVITGTTASVLVNFFLLIYLSVINPTYTTAIVKDGPMGDFMSPMGIVIVNFLEESASTVIITLMVMLFYMRKG